MVRGLFSFAVFLFRFLCYSSSRFSPLSHTLSSRALTFCPHFCYNFKIFISYLRITFSLHPSTHPSFSSLSLLHTHPHKLTFFPRRTPCPPPSQPNAHFVSPFYPPKAQTTSNSMGRRPLNRFPKSTRATRQRSLVSIGREALSIARRDLWGSALS